MAYLEKLNAFAREMEQHGVRSSTAVPPMCRALSHLGFELPPPLFQSPAQMVGCLGIPFGVLFSGAMYVTRWRSQGVSVVATVMLGVIAGVLFGLLLAWYYRRLARKYVLPTWSEYAPNSITKRV